MTEWTLTRVSEMADIVSGGTPKTEIPEYWNGDISWLSVKDFAGDTKHVYSSEKTITELGLNNSATQLLFPGDVIISARGTVGEIAQIGKTMAFNQSCYGLRAKEGYSSDYLYYVLKYQIKYLKKVANGAVFDTIILKTFDKMKLYVPDLATQKKIADILSAYDDLIENNLARISLLEKMASELYKEWFVRFRFPGHEAAKFVDSVPEGWCYRKFKDELTYNTGKLDSNAAVLDGDYNFYTCAKTIYKTNTYCFDGECVLLGGNNATGDFSLFYANEKLDAYQRTYIVTPKNPLLSCAYIYFVLNDYLLQFKTASIGAATKFLTKRMLDKAKILIPNENIILKYNGIVQSIFEQIISLKKQNEILVTQRDLLLPRLMSGKLSVEPLLADTA